MYTVEQMVLANGAGWTWVVRDKAKQIVCKGSHTSCSNAAREFNQIQRLTQADIDKRPANERPMNAWQQLFWRVARREAIQ